MLPKFCTLDNNWDMKLHGILLHDHKLSSYTYVAEWINESLDKGVTFESCIGGSGALCFKYGSVGRVSCVIYMVIWSRVKFMWPTLDPLPPQYTLCWIKFTLDRDNMQISWKYNCIKLLCWVHGTNNVHVHCSHMRRQRSMPWAYIFLSLPYFFQWFAKGLTQSTVNVQYFCFILQLCSNNVSTSICATELISKIFCYINR